MVTIETKILRRLNPAKRSTQTIGALSSQTWYILENETIESLAADLTDNPSIQAVAVVNGQMTVSGIIVRRNLLGLLARPFGREVLCRRPVKEQAEKVVSFPHDMNPLSVNEILSDQLNIDEISWYSLVDNQERYQGIFSSRDVLLYMSELSRSDLEMARNIQKKLTGEVSSIHEKTFDLVASSRVSKGVGGDYYSIDKYAEDQWMLSVCDVSGKGVAASLITSVMWGMASIFDFKKNGMREFIKIVNRYMHQTFNAEKFITGIFLDFNAATGEIFICDMGHSYIYLYRKGKLKRLRTNSKNLPIGIDPGNEPILNRIILNPGDILLIPTDGLMEQENLNGNLYTPERIERVLNIQGNQALDNIQSCLFADFNIFRKGSHLHDDATSMFLKYFDKHEDDQLGFQSEDS